MGMPLLTTSLSPVESVEARAAGNVEVVVAEQQPRTWTPGDEDPDQPCWWTKQQIFVESFTSNSPAAEPENQEPTGRLNAAGRNGEIVDEKEDMQADVDFSALFPAKFTISEDELAGVELDTVIDASDDEFELAWDDEEEENTDDMEIDSDAASSTLSTPAPSTPVAAARIVSLPVSVPSTPHRRTTLPVSLSSTPINIGTPIRQNSYHAHSPSMSPMPASSSITTRSVARVRGFAVHSPRTELVL